MISLEETLDTIDHSREKRGYFANLVLQHPELLPELLDICSRVDDEISCRASWGLEFLCKHRLDTILPYLDRLLNIMPSVYKHPAVRPMAKICEYLIVAYYKKRNSQVQKLLSVQHREQITEICFDWLITDQKVAPKAYSMTSLYLLGTEFDWVHPELKITLEKGYNAGSAAYKARSRMVLQKIR
ncbi:adenylosuccinate lyase [Aquimarina sp. 2201CG5-10]|uniref:adenylosuccinate lyase n=1 Tax=Aquimarina callyspongiae TaxID=3098150 RepID=UPI002AB4F39C|nr:adenylosuccinate lyase [Aquimarina sp. 2201CG5-10]MDY8138905.1 adenylosuccinate lyase [Aquimarina sp. 2201CG5-10]